MLAIYDRQCPYTIYQLLLSSIVRHSNAVLAIIATVCRCNNRKALFKVSPNPVVSKIIKKIS